MNQTPPKLNLLITVDGHSSAGKGTISQRLAYERGLHYLDSGAIYRTLALFSQQQEIETTNQERLIQLIPHIDLQFLVKSHGDADVMLNGEEINQAIRTSAMSKRASQLSVLPELRHVLLELQHAFYKPPGLVADGRDMGTVVFPNAHLKFFLTASLEERARRRHQQLLTKGISATLPDLIAELAERDKRDQERAVSPLKPSEDAVIIDTTPLPIDKVMEHVNQIVDEKIRQLSIV